MSVKFARAGLRLAFLLSAAATLLCLVLLLSVKSESASAVWFGFSAGRLALATFLSVGLFWLGFFTLKAWASQTWLAKTTKDAQKAVGGSFFLVSAFALLGIFLVSWVLFFMPATRTIEVFGQLALYVEQLRPILLNLVLLGLIWLPLILFMRLGFDAKALRARIKSVRLAILILAGLLFLILVIAVTGIGLGFDASVWNAPGTPLLGEQVVAAFLFGMLLLLALFFLGSKGGSQGFWKWLSQHRLNFALGALVWLIAALFWLGQPAEPTYYDTAPQAPNFQPYPLSDAFNHDVIANSVLAGEGFHFAGQTAIRRPAYVLFLAGLEGLLGGNYDAVIAAQVLVLALLPVFLFLLGAKFHSRLAGLFLAGLIILREANSIALGHVINTSHAKLLMADLPTALMTAALAMAAIAWLGRSPNGTKSLLVGGLLGASILLRSQSLTLVPFFLLLALLAWGWRSAWRPVLLFLLGVLLVAGPWIIRNRVQMGQWAIEDAVVSGFLAHRYSFTPGTYALPFETGETEGEYYARQMASVREFAAANPLYVVGFVSDNYVRNQTLNFLALPLSFTLRDLETHVRELPFWPGWEGVLPLESALPLLLGLALFSLGVSVAWQKAGWLGLTPLFINLGFTANLALARVSGWRYNLPIDWTVLLYFALGVAQIAFWAFALTSKNSNVRKFTLFLEGEETRASKKKVPSNWLPAAIAVLLVAGLSFSIIEAFSQPRYSKVELGRLEEILAAAELGNGETNKQGLLTLFEADRLEAIEGRAIHPRFFEAGDGLDRDFLLVSPMDFSRLTFYLVGPDPTSVILQTTASDIPLASGADAVVLRCTEQPEVAGIAVIRPGTSPLLYISPDLSRVCP